MGACKKRKGSTPGPLCGGDLGCVLLSRGKKVAAMVTLTTVIHAVEVMPMLAGGCCPHYSFFCFVAAVCVVHCRGWNIALIVFPMFVVDFVLAAGFVTVVAPVGRCIWSSSAKGQARKGTVSLVSCCTASRSCACPTARKSL